MSGQTWRPEINWKDLDQEHYTDPAGNPAGGWTRMLVDPGRGAALSIVWQNGPLGRHGAECAPGKPCSSDCTRVMQSGAFVEDVIRAAINRMEFYQSGKFKCRENALAITKLEEALHWLNARTARRDARGVEGTHAE